MATVALVGPRRSERMPAARLEMTMVRVTKP
jgi:hypothetical protein